MTALLMGTAGHIDHGKTALIKALTGVDLDRLEEEKRRGITIELGFVGLDLGEGLMIGVVDVPGHERFVKTMVAGAQGLDMVMLVVAADEGVMPQTVEHLDICRLLGVRKGLTALTKSDRADDETRLLAAEEVEELIKGTFLEGSPVIACSAVTGEGVDQLRKAIAEVAQSLPSRSDEGIFRMPIDRSFSIKGFGTVVTGSVLAGKIEKGSEVEIIPSGKVATVRELEVHDEKVDSATAGRRLAVNLAGVDRGEVGRGIWLALPGALRPTRTVDVMLEALKSADAPLEHGTEILLHAGTAHVLAEIDLFADKVIKPGDGDMARLHVKAPLAMLAGDRFVLRSFARQTTVAGGEVLDPLPGERVVHRGRKGKRQAPVFLEDFASADPGHRLEMLVTASDRLGALASHLSQRMPVTPRETEQIAGELVHKKKIIRIDGRDELLVEKSVFDSIGADVIDQLEKHHKNNPMDAGLSKGALKNKRLPRIPDSIYSAVIDALSGEGKIESDGDLLRLKGHRAKAAGKDEKDVTMIEQALLESGNSPPSPVQLAEKLGRDRKEILRLLKFLTDSGRARRVSEDLFYHPGAIEEVRRQLVHFLEKKEEIGPVDFKELTGTSRKFAIALLEYFDKERVTIRVGDKRILRKVDSGQ